LRWNDFNPTGNDDILAVDDFSLTPSSGPVNPTITLSAAAFTAFTTVEGTASAAQSYTVAGSNLTADISIVAPTGYELALETTPGSNTAGTYAAYPAGAPLVLTQTSGTVASSRLFVRLAASATAAGSPYNGNLVHTSGTVTENKAVSGTVTAPAAPTVTTTAASSVTTTTAQTGGNVTLANGSAVTARGVVYGTAPNPRLGDAGVTQVADNPGTGTGTFTSNLTGLTPSTPYYIAAYATNGVGTSYGSDQTFTTATPATTPTVSTTAASNVTAVSAQSGGNVTLTGGASITGRGIVFGTAPNPRIGGPGVTQVTASGTTGSFTSNLTGLTPSTPYYIAAYATNGVGTSYGSDQTFTTLPATITAAPTSLSGFSTTAGTASASQSYVLTGSGLSSPITVTAPTGYEVSLTSGGTYAGSVSVAAAGGTVYVRLASTATAGVNNGSITNTSGAASATVAVNGYVLPAGSSACISEDFSGLSTSTPAGWTLTGTGIYTSTGTSGAAVPAVQFNSTGDEAVTPSVSNPVQLRFFILGNSTDAASSLLVEGFDGTTSAYRTIATINPLPTSRANGTFTYNASTTANFSDFTRFRFTYTKGAGNLSFDDVTVNCAPIPGAEINVTQNGSSISSGGAYDFGFVSSGSNATATFTIQNLGSSDLTLGGTPAVQLSGSPDFAVTTQPASTVAGSGSTTFVVTFTPTATTPQTATLSIANNDATDNENPYTITLNGSVPVPYVWNGSGTSWSAAGSWTPARTTPNALDVLVFDGTTTPTAAVTIDFTTSQTVAQLELRNNVAATFSNTGTRTLTINNGNSSGADLLVGAGSSLTVTNPTTTTGLTLQLGTGATASIAGAVVLDNGAHRLQGSGTNSVEFASGGSFRAGTSLSGSPFGAAASNANTVVFRSGSRLEQAGGSQPFGLTAPASAITLEAGSLYVYSVPADGSTPPLANRTFGNLEFNVGSGIGAASGANNGFTVLGDLTVTSGIIGLNLDNDINIAGNISVAAGSTLTFIPEAGGIETVSLNGTTAQTISGAGTLTFGPTSNLQINNAAGVVLARPLALSRLQLSSGTLSTDDTNLLTLSSNVTMSGGSATSYINGPLKRNVAAVPAGTPRSVVFPIGRAGVYRPLSLTINEQAGTVGYTAVQTASTAGSRLADAPLQRVSGRRYFTVTPDGPGFVNGTVTLSFDTDDQATDAASLRVGQSTGGNWMDLGGTATAVPAGTITSGTFTSFGDFVLATTAADLSTNPLPVVLTSFTAQRQSPGALLKWTTAQEKNSARFEVQRSTNGREFTIIGTVDAAGNSSVARSYRFEDRNAPAGRVYYRLHQLDHDATGTYSEIVTLSGNGNVELQLFPNPTRHTLRASAPAAQQWQVLNLLGQPVLKGRCLDGQASVDVSALAPGSYYLEVRTADQVRLVQRFVKE
jgi:hypothetical protein